MKNVVTAIAALLLTGFSLSAQNVNFTLVYNTLQTNCVSCHSNAAPQGGLDLEGAGGTAQAKRTDVYNKLVGINPTNAAAAAKGYKLVTKGRPDLSFLLRKVAHSQFENGRYALANGEGAAMPNNQAAISNKEVEYIRQWVMYGANSSGNAGSNTKAKVDNYYDGLALPSIAQPAAPAAGQGEQIYLGKIFLSPGEEVEYYQKYRLNLPEGKEVNRMDLKMNNFSHHYILFKFEPGTEQQYPEGLRSVSVFNVFPDETKYISTWSNEGDLLFPEGTAHTFEANTVLDLNYHINNYNQDSILGAEAYLNIYYQPLGTAVKEMYSDLVLYPVSNLIIPGNNDEYTFTDSEFDANSNLIYNIWTLKSHTHKYGTDYDIYVRNPDGSKGEQLYEGFMDETHTQNLGYYNWSHPPIRFFEPLKPVPAKNGIIHEGKFRNCCTQPLVTFGLTTDEEMMLYYIQYTVDIAANTNEALAPQMLQVFPNPAQTNLYVQYFLKDAADTQIELVNMQGQTVYSNTLTKAEKGISHTKIDLASLNLAPANYLVKVTANGVAAKKIVCIQ